MQAGLAALLWSVVSGRVVLDCLLYIGGDTYWVIGLEAFRTTRLVLGFLLGMATILSLAVLVNRFLRYVVLEGVAAPALGNAVPQLHVHIIARRKSDAAWPRPVWGVMPALAHDAGEVQTFISAIRRKIWLG